MTAGPVYNIAQLVEDPHVQARQILVEVPDAEMGTVPMHNVVPRLLGTPGAIRRPAPALGEHTAEVLTTIGVQASELESLVREGVVECQPIPGGDSR